MKKKSNDTDQSEETQSTNQITKHGFKMKSVQFSFEQINGKFEKQNESKRKCVKFQESD